MNKTHPDQVRLNAYLANFLTALGPLPDDARPLFLHMDVGVRDEAKLLTHHDLENYLTPLFGSRTLNSARFPLVSARKRVGDGSHVHVGYAEQRRDSLTAGWHAFETRIEAGLDRARKAQLREQIACESVPLPPECPVEVRLAFRCSTRRNWSNLWKPTGDCMGPILGFTRKDGFNPRDDRIVSLELHREIDDDLGNAVDIGMRWRSI